jgi:hypothetical protein
LDTSRKVISGKMGKAEFPAPLDQRLLAAPVCARGLCGFQLHLLAAEWAEEFSVERLDVRPSLFRKMQLARCDYDGQLKGSSEFLWQIYLGTSGCRLCTGIETSAYHFGPDPAKPLGDRNSVTFPEHRLV